MYSMHNMQNCNSHSIMSSSIHLNHVCSLTLGIEAATQLRSAKAQASSLPTMPLTASHKQEAADQAAAAQTMHSSPNSVQPSPQLQANAASAHVVACAQQFLPEQATETDKSSRQTAGEEGGCYRKRTQASRASAAQAAEPSEAKHSKCRKQGLAATPPAPDERHRNQDSTTSLQAAAGSHGSGEAGKVASFAPLYCKFVQHIAVNLMSLCN